MKTLWKAVIALIAAGLIFSLSGVLMGASRWIYWDKSGPQVVASSEEKRITELDLAQIENIDIDANFSDVEFIKSDKYGIDIRYYDADVSWSLSDGNLKINFDVQTRNRYFGINLSFNYPSNYIKVYLPADVALGAVSIKADSGEIKIGDFRAGDVRISNSFGKLDTDSITCNKLRIEMSSCDFAGKNLSVSGDIEYKNTFGSTKFETINAKNFTLRSESGDVTIRGCDVEGLDIQNTFGRLDIYSITCNKLQIEMNACDFLGKDLSVSGDILYKNRFGESKFETVTAKNFVLDSNAGDVTVKGCSVEGIDIKNTFGKITARNLVSYKTDIDAGSTEIDVSGTFWGQTVINNTFDDIRFTTSKAREDYTYDLSTVFGDVVIDGDKGRSSTRGGNASENSLEITNSNGNIRVYFAK